MVKSSSIALFKNELHKIITRETMRNPNSLIRLVEAEGEGEEDVAATTKGEAEEEKSEIKKEDEKIPHDTGPQRSDKLTLSVYGAASNSYPKQVFASVRQDALDLTPGLLNEAGLLPNGITSSAIVPVFRRNKSDAKESHRRFGEVFGSHSAKPLDPPTHQSTHTTTRGQQVNWYRPSNPFPTQPRMGPRESYYNQPLKTGYWLSYNAGPAASKMLSTGERRKLRDRALSTGEPHAELSEGELEEIRLIKEARQQARDEALFKNVYSSFAPSHDNAGAVISHEMKNRLWFNRHDRSKRQEYPDLPDWASPARKNDDTAERGNQDEVDEAEIFREAVENYEEIKREALDESILQNGAFERTGDKDVDEILGEVSDLIETLYSYQRRRNVHFPPNAQSTTPQKKALAELIGTPSKPSAAEFDLYEMLRNQLAVLVATLPPFAVAKLNGNQLGELNISTRIPVEEPNHEGLLEEHESVKYPPSSVNANTASTSRSPMSGLARPGSYQSQVATPTSRNASYGAARPLQTPSQSYAGRPPLTANQYGSYTPQGSSTNSKVSYSQYGQQNPSGHPNQYANGTRQYAATNGYPSYSQYGATATSPNPPTRPTPQQRPSQPGYQQRAQNAQSYSSYSQQAHRSASPQNPAEAYAAAAQQRSSYGAATTPVQRAGYYPPSQNYGGSSSQAGARTPATHAGNSSGTGHGYAPGRNAAAVQYNGTVGQAANLTEKDALAAAEREMALRNAKIAQGQTAALAQQTQQVPAAQTNGATGQYNVDGGQA